MCLAVPGKIVAVQNAGDPAGIGTVGTVDFQGTRIDVSLAFTPEAREGDWVLVHAGFALQTLNEQEAMETWQYLEPDAVAEVQGKPPEAGEAEQAGK
jgi:hydrogenase expression/formation protein HypC